MSIELTTAIPSILEIAQGIYAGVYTLSSNVNNKPSWSSALYTIKLHKTHGWVIADNSNTIVATEANWPVVEVKG